MDYSPARTGLVVSASDYHHSRAVRPEPQLDKHKRSNSQFSVFNQEHMVSKHSFFETAEEGDHFDPFGIESQGESSTAGPSTQKPMIRVVKPATRPGQRDSLRVETLKRKGSARHSGYARGSSSNTSGRLSSGSRRSISVGSLQQGTPTPIVIRPGDKHKRNVSFDHRRRTASATASERTSSGLPLPGSYLPSSPPAVAGAPSFAPAPTLRTTRLRDFDIEARKVSHELGKVCEEAFFRTSLSERSLISSFSDLVLKDPADTPPSSLSNQSANMAQKAVERSYLNRPLPPPPAEETPSSYTARELQQIRDRLAVRYAQDGASNQKYFNDILTQLDNLVPAVGIDGDSQLKRGLGSSYRLSELNLLQSIPEEGRSGGHDSSSARSSLLGQAQAGAQRRGRGSPAGAKNKTIRVVEPSSPGSHSPWAPLNIRKTSAMSNQSNATVIRRPGARSPLAGGKYIQSQEL
jgi:serine/threonine-protein kinase HSL1, negative regulator of Swe1 kinase